jgi:hypothetical protein
MHRGERAAQVVAQDAEEQLARALELAGITLDRSDERFVDRFVEAGQLVQRVLVGASHVEHPEPDHARPQRAVFRHQLAEVEARSPALAGVLLSRRIGRAAAFPALGFRFLLHGGLRLRHVVRDGPQDRFGLVAQRLRRHVAGGGDRPRVLLPLEEDRLHVGEDEIRQTGRGLQHGHGPLGRLVWHVPRQRGAMHVAAHREVVVGLRSAWCTPGEELLHRL